MSGFKSIQQSRSFRAGGVDPEGNTPGDEAEIVSIFGGGRVLTGEVRPMEWRQLKNIPIASAPQSAPKGGASDGDADGQSAAADTPLDPRVEALLAEAEQRGREMAKVEFADQQDKLQRELQSVEAVKTQCVRLVDQLAQAQEDWEETLRVGIGDVVVSGVQHLVTEVPELLESMLRSRLREIAEQLTRETAVEVRVCPEQEELARSIVGDRAGWVVRADASVRGGAVAETASGRLLGGVDVALDALQEVVEAWRQEVSKPVGTTPVQQNVDDKPDAVEPVAGEE